MGGKEPIKGGETKRNKVEREKKERDGGGGSQWVGRGHATQIGPPPDPICGPRDLKRRGEGEPTVGKGWVEEGGVAAGQGG